MRKTVWALALVVCSALGTVAWGEQLPWPHAKGQGTFLILSDIHFDPYADPSLVTQLAASPVDQWASLFESSSLTKFCAYGKDTNDPLFQSSLAQAVSLTDHYDYVLVNGDYLSHGFRAAFTKSLHGGEKAYQDFVLKTMVFVSRQIQQAFPNQPVYFCLGNNDSDCDDYGGIASDSSFLPTLAQEWKTISADPEAVKTFIEGGYYTLPHPTLKNRRFVVFNDVSWSAKYAPACHAPGMIGKDQLAWLSQVLKKARQNHERLTLITHMPPGIHGRNASEHEDRTKAQHTFYEENYLWGFLNLLAPYRDLIDGQFSGHTHMDDFRVVQDRGGKNVFFTHIAPAVSPVRFNNPGFQVMLYDRTTGTLADMATYYLPLDASAPEWKLEYTFHEAYGYSTYDSDSLQSLADAIETDPKVREKFIRFATQESQTDPPANMQNWRFFGCAHTHLDPKSYMDCYR
jgi:3',5'-cyclic AMP phosphodiesterase CpdA